MVIDSMQLLVTLIPIFPLLGFLIIGLTNKKLPNKIVGLIACGSVSLSFISGLYSLLNLLGMSSELRLINSHLFDWIVIGTFKTTVSFAFDPLSAVMVLVVSGVGLLIHIYSIGYMSHDKGFARYFAYLNLFTFSMLVLVLADNLLLMFVGWEGVGLCSYLLIGFWFHKKSATDAGKKAFIVNRIGDFGFLLGVMLIFWNFGTLNIREIAAQAPQLAHLGGGLITAIALLLFLGATGKSAQIPLYIWLPDAMEGPTPVSALIHAATMVTAGVYMVVRLSALYILSPTALTVVAIVGGVTALFAATIGLVQNDIKRVLAYSTISQIGYMFLACGVAAFSAGIFHLMTHAFFKALLFMAAGSVIHALSGEQDMRNMGGLKPHLPHTYRVLLIGTLAISGVPLLAGFFSKDEILWLAFSSPHGNPIFWLLGILAAVLTAFYMFRLLYLTFYGKTNLSSESLHHVHESPKVMTTPLYILALLSIVGGYIGLPHSLGGGAWFEKFLEPVIAKPELIETAVHNPGSSEYLFMILSIIAAATGITAAYVFYIKNPERPKRLAIKMSGAYQLILHKYYIDEIYDYIVVKPLYIISLIFWKVFDVGVIDGFINGTARFFGTSSQRLRVFQTGYVRNYILIFLIGVIALLGYCILR
jgi:NADH-quinone oxidoreductase subunit L